MCDIVTEFYLYSIVYIYLINSRLDVTYSVRHHFRTLQTLSMSIVVTFQKHHFYIISSLRVMTNRESLVEIETV